MIVLDDKQNIFYDYDCFIFVYVYHGDLINGVVVVDDDDVVFVVVCRDLRWCRL